MSAENIVAAVKNFIDRNIPISVEDKIIVGLSGGADSVALLSLLKELGFSCIAAHCNFMLRGDESVRDRNFAASTAACLEIPFTEIVFDTKEYASKKSLSIEMACRELRYEWFEQRRKHYGCRYISVAHHRDDSVETVIINLIRGTGISGLTGISPINGNVIRPLLPLSRKDIESYLAERRLAFVTDSTNLESVYVRNKVRNILLPIMATINPSVYTSLELTASNLREAENLYKEAVDRAKEQIVSYDGENIYVSVDALKNQISARTVMFEIIKQYGFMPTQLDDIMLSLRSGSGQRFFSLTHRMVKNRGSLIISPIEKEDTVTPELSAEEILTIEYIGRSELEKLGKNRYSVCFDADKIELPLTVRHWKKGDRFTPFGMKGSQKLSDYFNNHKFTNLQKECAELLVSSGEIIWIIGERQSDKYKITNTTKRVARFTKKQI